MESNPHSIAEPDPTKVGSDSKDNLPGGSGNYHFPWQTMFWFVVILVALGLVIWSLGQAGQGILAGWLSSPMLGSQPPFKLMDMNNNRILMLETNGRQNRVLIQEAGNINWLLVSRDDFTAESPALSADGSTVAYRSALGNGQIEVVSLDSQARVVIDDAILKSVAPNLAVCSWTPIAWSGDSASISFFACDTETGGSSALWTEVDSIRPQKVTGTESQNTQPRQLQWLNASQISVSSPVADSNGKFVTTHDVK